MQSTVSYLQYWVGFKFGQVSDGKTNKSCSQHEVIVLFKVISNKLHALCWEMCMKD